VSTDLRAYETANKLLTGSNGLVPCSCAAVGVVLGDAAGGGCSIRANLGSCV
jgi:hypothetical protein